MYRNIPQSIVVKIKVRGNLAYGTSEMVNKLLPATDARRLYEETFRDRVKSFLDAVSEGAKFELDQIKKGIK